MASNADLISLLQTISADRIIAFNPLYARIGGSVHAGLMLSQLLYWTPRSSLKGAWIYKTYIEWESETALTRREQDSAKKNLVQKGLISIKKKGIPATLHFKVNFEKVVELIQAYAPQGNQESEPQQEYRGQVLKKTKKAAETYTEVQLHKSAKLDAPISQTCMAESAKLDAPISQTNSYTSIDSSIDFVSKEEKDMEGGSFAKPKHSPSRSGAHLGFDSAVGGERRVEEETANSPDPQSAHWKEKVQSLSQSLINGDAVEKGVVQLLVVQMMSDILSKKFAPSLAFKRAIAKSNSADIVAAMVGMGGDVEAGRLEGMRDPVGVFVAMLCPKKDRVAASKGRGAIVGDETALPSVPKSLKADEIGEWLQPFDFMAGTVKQEDEVFAVERVKVKGVERFLVKPFYIVMGRVDNQNELVVDVVSNPKSFADPRSMRIESFPAKASEDKYLAIRKT